MFSLYKRSFAVVIVYMLQSTEYQALPYLKWFWKTTNFSAVMKRRTLDKTKAAKGFLFVLRAGMYAQLLTGIALFFWSIKFPQNGTLPLALTLMITYPIIWAHLMIIPLSLARLFVVKPKEKKRRLHTNHLLTKHSALRIAVAGSYGKTTMKELLLTVLSEGKNVKATPANKNTPHAHHAFTQKLSGDEDVLIYELGEGKPSDVAEFCRTLDPNVGFITGLAPAHLDHYKDIDDAGSDIMSLSKHLKGNVYINGESPNLKKFIEKNNLVYSQAGCDDYKVKNVHVDFEGTHFDLAYGKHSLKLHSGLLGKHQVGPLASVAVFAKRCGLTDKQIIAGISKTTPYEHRMQPKVVAGAWVIDDTYNGNIEGIKAGVALLKDLPATRRIYVTPGLVDQGKEKEVVHIELGTLLASGIDEIVLMQNSVTDYIKAGLKKGGFKGKLSLQNDPLEFYTNLDKVVAIGDVVMMQNDWTDNYK